MILAGVLFGPGQQLDVAEQTMLAAPTANGTRWRIIEVAKGHAVPGRVIAEPVDGAGPVALRASPSGIIAVYDTGRSDAVRRRRLNEAASVFLDDLLTRIERLPWSEVPTPWSTDERAARDTRT